MLCAHVTRAWMDSLKAANPSLSPLVKRERSGCSFPLAGPLPRFELLFRIQRQLDHSLQQLLPNNPASSFLS
jgi:hypothetical protein